MTTTSQFTLPERNGLVYKPHPRFLAQNCTKKVRLIHESLRYIINLLQTETTSFGDSNSAVSLLYLMQAYRKYVDIYMCGCRTMPANDHANVPLEHLEKMFQIIDLNL